MKNSLDRLFIHNINGAHKLSSPTQPQIMLASESFCEILGYTEGELDGTDFTSLIHPDDREIFLALLRCLTPNGKQSPRTARMKMLRKNGSVCHVSESVSLYISKNGDIAVYGTLTDMTPTVEENEELDYLRTGVPCGFLTLTCEEHPKIIYMNERMSHILRVPENAEGVPYPLRLLGNDVYLMIPVEERMHFAEILSHAQNAGGKAIYSELSALRFDGVRIRLSGWISRFADDSGRQLLRAVCTDITERYDFQKGKERQQLLGVLRDVYNKIFLCDLKSKTITCLEGESSALFNNIQNIPMHLAEAAAHWIDTAVSEESRQVVRDFAADIFNHRAKGENGMPPKIEFCALSSSGEEKSYTATYVEIDETSGLFCCRRNGDSRRSSELTANVKELVMQMTDGIVAFEIEDARIRPLYASENVRTFFGYTKEEWAYLARKSRSLKDFVSRSGIAYSEFVKIFDSGEAEFDYTDLSTGTRRRIRAVSSHAADDGTPRYVMLYNADDSAISASNGTLTVKPRVFIRTFGYFDVFIGDKPIAFRNEKSKELFALLVDRKGGYISSEEAISFLWENEPVNSVTLARYRKVALRLKNILEEYGISDIVESVNGKRRLVTDKVRCDLYDYLSHREKYSHLFKGSYLTNYSWGENTLAELVN